MIRARAAMRARLLIVVGLALYAIVLIGSPFEHHDLVCHLKTPQHCTSCASSQLGSDVLTLIAPGASVLDDAGTAITLDRTLERMLLIVPTSGRSPPHTAYCAFDLRVVRTFRSA
jgi:hypothetical protein